MPRLMSTNDTEIINIPGAGNFQFSAIRPENLDGSTEYTLVTIVVDISGSVVNFADKLLDCIKSIIKSCKKSPKPENLLIRFITFNEHIKEIHGFKPLGDIDISSYDKFCPMGLTSLYDATFSGIAATLAYAKNLIDQDFDVNGCVYIITDGLDNRSTITPNHILKETKKAISGEEIESLITILIGLNDPISGSGYLTEIVKALKYFKEESGLTQFIDIGDATSKKLAKLGNFISQSISSQSQSLGTGAGSQPLTF